MRRQAEIRLGLLECAKEAQRLRCTAWQAGELVSLIDERQHVQAHPARAGDLISGRHSCRHGCSFRVAARRRGAENRHKTTRYEKQCFSLDERPEFRETGDCPDHSVSPASAGCKARRFGGLLHFWVSSFRRKLGLRLGRIIRVVAYDAVTSDLRRAIRDSALKALSVAINWRYRAMREALPLALSGIFAQGNCQFATRRIVICSTYGAAGDGDDRQGNWARLGNGVGPSLILSSLEIDLANPDLL